MTGQYACFAPLAASLLQCFPRYPCFHGGCSEPAAGLLAELCHCDAGVMSHLFRVCLFCKIEICEMIFQNLSNFVS